MQDAVGVDVERDLDLRHAARSRRDARELKLADGAIVHGQFALALQHMNFDRRLIIVGGGKRLRLLGRDGRVARDEHRHHATKRFDTKRERRDVEQQDVLLLAGEHRALNGGADGHDFVRIDALVGLLAEELLHDLLNFRNARRTAHEDDLVDFTWLHARILERLLHGLERALNEIVHQLFELGPRERVVQVLGTRLVGSDEREVDVGAVRARQLHLRLFRRFLETLNRHRILAQVDRLIALELGHQPIHHALIEIVAAEVGVTVGRLHFELTRPVYVVQFEHGDVVRSAAQIKHGDLFVGFLVLVEAVGECRRRGLVDDAEHVEAGDLARVLGGLTLRVVEICRHRDHRLRYAMAEVIFGGLLHFLQNHGRDFGRRIAFAAYLDRGYVVRSGHDLVRHPRLLRLSFRGPLTHKALD